MHPPGAGAGQPARTPRVLFVSSHARLGGSERVLEDLLGRLPAEAVVDVVLLEHGPFAAQLRQRGLPVTVLPTGTRPYSPLPVAWRLRRRLAASRPDVVHANGVKAALVAVLASRRTPVVWMKHDVSFDGRVGRLVASRCARVVGVSTEVLRGLLGQPRLDVVHPGVSVSPAAAQEGGARLRQRLGLAGPVVAVVGRLDPAKGHRELVEVLPSLAARVPGVHVLLAGGDDPQHPGVREALRATAERLGVLDRVHLLGHVPAEEVLGASDAVCIATVPHPDGAGREGFGLVAAEAMALGVPVVGYDVGATGEVLGGCGMLVRPGDRVGLEEALVQVLDDGPAAEQARRCGRERAQSLTVERMAEQLLAVYRGVVA